MDLGVVSFFSLGSGGVFGGAAAGREVVVPRSVAQFIFAVWRRSSFVGRPVGAAYAAVVHRFLRRRALRQVEQVLGIATLSFLAS